MTDSIQRIKGVRDILPGEIPRWRRLESTVHTLLHRSGYEELRTPVFEATELFIRGIGDETDIVHKEMYTFSDQGGKSLTLKPELTAPVVRAYIQNHLGRKSPLTRLYYIDALFRQERPQAGRLRQFHQFGIEALGSAHPEQDIEVIALAYQICVDLQVAGLSLQLNTVGGTDARKKYLDTLQEALQPYAGQLGDTDRVRLANNPLRIFDSKDPQTHEILREHAPLIPDHVSAEDRIHFDAVQDGLSTLGIPYKLNPLLVRGLDYYTRTTFELTSEVLGAQDAVCGGGRYDGLVEQLGGEQTPAVGFAAGIERLLLAMEQPGDDHLSPMDIYLVILGEGAITGGLKLADDLRRLGYATAMETLRRSARAQLRDANRKGVPIVIILGEEEAAKKVCTVKRMDTGDQQEVDQSNLAEHLRTLLPAVR